MNLEFREPWFLLFCLAAVPVFVLSRYTLGRIVYSSLTLLPRQAKTWRVRLVWLPDVVLALATVALGVALAGPRVPGGTTRIQREGIAIMMVVDVSGSMRALDLSSRTREQSRLDVVQNVFHAFVAGDESLEGRPDDLVGLVSFARYPDSACPLTLDHGNLLSIADDLEIVTQREEDGTAMGDALGLAVERLRKTDVASKIVILLTDGVNNAGEDAPLDAAQLAKTLGIKVYTIGAGTDGLAPIRIEDPWTGQSRLTQVRVDIDEETLREIADRTSGRYFRVTDRGTMRAVYKEIDRLEKGRVTEDRMEEFNEHFELATGVALGLAIFGWLLGASVLRRQP